jgi:hypothetical protein
MIATAMELISTLKNGTTIEQYIDGGGHLTYRICTPSQAICRLTDVHHCATGYAETFDQMALKPGTAKTVKTVKTKGENGGEEG